MPRRFKEARIMNNLTAVEAAEKLGVATPTLSAWESEKKSPPIVLSFQWLNYITFLLIILLATIFNLQYQRLLLLQKKQFLSTTVVPFGWSNTVGHW